MLQGIRVLDLSRVIAGPYAAALLGDLGADVIKLERPGRGDDMRAVRGNGQMSAAFAAVNRNKRGIAVDLQTPEGPRLAFELEWKQPRQQSQELLRALRDLLDLEVEPQRIECFDISNIQGSDVVASMVVFEKGLAKKSDYRKFRIRSVSGMPDDFASMREVVGRRYKRLLEENKELPDLVLIDGGKGQLGAAIAALEELGLGEQAVASLAKREELIFVRGREEPIALPRNSPVLQLVQRVRDEAHRFAIGYHRKLRSRHGGCVYGSGGFRTTGKVRSAGASPASRARASQVRGVGTPAARAAATVRLLSNAPSRIACSAKSSVASMSARRRLSSRMTGSLAAMTNRGRTRRNTSTACAMPSAGSAARSAA